uniref:Intraflagellar transport protein 57 homolog n=1 Tax=Takifugu rubripes TaxID=31033 RepID=H2TN72_TAKRU
MADGRRPDDRGPGADYCVFALMEGLLEKLKLLDYEKVLAKHIRNLSRHYFGSSCHVLSKQFYMFAIIAAWLINKAGRPFPQPLKHDEPNAIAFNILAELQAFGVQVDFPPSRLKSGSGVHVCFVLDRLAGEALKRTGFAFRRPKYPAESPEVEAVVEDDAALTLSKVEAIQPTEDDDVLDTVNLQSTHPEPQPSTTAGDISESSVDAAEWNLEVERGLTQLNVTTRSDKKQWRIYLDQMHQHNDQIKCLMEDSKRYLARQQEDTSKALEKFSSKKKYISQKLEPLIQEYLSVQARLHEEQERYEQANARVMEKRQELTEISDEVMKIKQEIDVRNMTDGAPVAWIRCSLTRLRQEVVQMDEKIGIVQHLLLQATLKEKPDMI